MGAQAGPIQVQAWPQARLSEVAQGCWGPDRQDVDDGGEDHELVWETSMSGLWHGEHGTGCSQLGQVLLGDLIGPIHGILSLTGAGGPKRAGGEPRHRAARAHLCSRKAFPIGTMLVECRLLVDGPAGPTKALWSAKRPQPQSASFEHKLSLLCVGVSGF